MKLNDAARALIGSGADATLVTLNPDGSPQVSVVWVALQSGEDGDELVTAHLSEHQKVRNVRRDGRVALTIVSTTPGEVMRPYLSVKGTARIEDGGAPELLRELASVMVTDESVVFPPAGAPPGYLTRIRIDSIGGVGPWLD
ncbi:PPOX class probable F420-dependent enzyme [Mycolicibacterium sp. BK556]|uniref:PPOX class F420-dependent oxidoreductase n=1 Tax=Mycobacteriaceae TaxID=1762 RepID=UPI00105D724D|nr:MULTISPECIES: PPOX class F420-dependent oxidoreductase [Mycobacteriaceae]MBB3603924.1 PPOX class probable F420-dependent enzyme [Mycolicibacterium sp. BK556]MBB3634119.1 PPOX class probable F420-dependent enzyme [Mycolicibacterium sp. BK607]MBB3751700.1 PPOX class probable F420-dependent enzyme [Mycolicibacterium sp. BK634]TDO12214.1 PPOX class probable F420-dependent enzyme [Mycobacterium sp. BK086]